ncbi:hypothetical protein HDU76_004132, partial [Blyttiomyces sp. JEL0837]
MAWIHSNGMQITSVLVCDDHQKQRSIEDKVKLYSINLLLRLINGNFASDQSSTNLYEAVEDLLEVSKLHVNQTMSTQLTEITDWPTHLQQILKSDITPSTKTQLDTILNHITDTQLSTFPQPQTLYALCDIGHIDFIQYLLTLPTVTEPHIIQAMIVAAKASHLDVIECLMRCEKKPSKMGVDVAVSLLRAGLHTALKVDGEGATTISPQKIPTLTISTTTPAGGVRSGVDTESTDASAVYLLRNLFEMFPTSSALNLLYKTIGLEHIIWSASMDLPAVLEWVLSKDLWKVSDDPDSKIVLTDGEVDAVKSIRKGRGGGKNLLVNGDQGGFGVASAATGMIAVLDKTEAMGIALMRACTGGYSHCVRVLLEGGGGSGGGGLSIHVGWLEKGMMNAVSGNHGEIGVIIKGFIERAKVSRGGWFTRWAGEYVERKRTRAKIGGGGGGKGRVRDGGRDGGVDSEVEVEVIVPVGWKREVVPVVNVIPPTPSSPKKMMEGGIVEASAVVTKTVSEQIVEQKAQGEVVKGRETTVPIQHEEPIPIAPPRRSSKPDMVMTVESSKDDEQI